MSNFNDRISDAKTRLMLLTRMIAVFETYQSEVGQTILTFDQIATKLPEVERCSLAGEHLCLSVLSSLDDTISPLMHKVILHAISQKWPELHAEPVPDPGRVCA